MRAHDGDKPLCFPLSKRSQPQIRVAFRGCVSSCISRISSRRGASGNAAARAESILALPLTPVPLTCAAGGQVAQLAVAGFPHAPRVSERPGAPPGGAGDARLGPAGAAAAAVCSMRGADSASLVSTCFQCTKLTRCCQPVIQRSLNRHRLTSFHLVMYIEHAVRSLSQLRCCLVGRRMLLRLNNSNRRHALVAGAVLRGGGHPEHTAGRRVDNGPPVLAATAGAALMQSLWTLS